MQSAKKIIKELAGLLGSLGIKYMIIGGQAAIVHGQMRFTLDIDLSVQLAPSEYYKIEPIMRGNPLEPTIEDIPDFLKHSYVLPARHAIDKMPIDITFAVSEYERQAIDRSVPIELGKDIVHFISPEDLVIHKLVAGRIQDQLDLRAVLLKNEKELDIDYIIHWARKFDEQLEMDLEFNLKEMQRKIARGDN